MRTAFGCFLIYAAAMAVPSATLHASTFADADFTALARGLGNDTLDGGSNTDISESPDDDSVTATATMFAAYNNDEGTHSATITGSATASIGDLGVVIGGTASGQGKGGGLFTSGYAEARGSAHASWIDQVEISTPLLPTGTQIKVTWDLLLHGNVSADTSGQEADAHVSVLIGDIGTGDGFPPPPYTNGLWGEANSSSFGSTVREIPSKIHVLKTINMGVQFDIGYSLYIGGGVQTDLGNAPFRSGNATMTGNVSGSLHWGGIQSVTDLEGNVIPRDQWTIVSDSGFDYSKPFVRVPEPSTAIHLVVTFLCALFITPPRSRPSREEKVGKKGNSHRPSRCPFVHRWRIGLSSKLRDSSFSID